MEFALQKVVKYVLHYSKLEIQLCRISNITEDTLNVSFEASSSNTYGVPVTISGMPLDLCGPKGAFGQVTVPTMASEKYGFHIALSNQLIHITDKEALQAFVQTLMRDDKFILSLKNGHSTVQALGLGPRPVLVEKDVKVNGMSGPKMTIIKASCTGNNVRMTVRMPNPSPMEIGFGTCSFEILNSDGEVLVETKGGMDIRRGITDVTTEGPVDRSVLAKPPFRVIGKGCPGAGWCDTIIKSIDSELSGTEKLLTALEVQREETVYEHDIEKEALVKSDTKRGLKLWRKTPVPDIA